MWPDSAVGMGEKKTLSGSDEDGSPSPGSTGSEGAPCGSDDDYDTRQHRKARARTGSMVKIRPRKASHVRHAKTRSRSSTVASLAAPLVLPTSATSSPAGSGIDLPTSSQVQQLDNTTTKVRRSSQSSAQTVVAPSLRGPDQDPATHLVDIAADETHLVLDSWNGMSEQQKLTVVEEEAKFRGAVWRALNDALEEFADHVGRPSKPYNQGDIQMCAMLSLFAAEELGLELVRIVQFTEAYIDMLMRYRLHTSAAYIRKHAQAEDIRKTTGLETTIYTSFCVQRAEHL
ncbi:hypothetical protein ID866_8286 [Astraeus odoratus]|nr:hypothetical protein ID866_8286 [Astraeus odoratus]